MVSWGVIRFGFSFCIIFFSLVLVDIFELFVDVLLKDFDNVFMGFNLDVLEGGL